MPARLILILTILLCIEGRVLTKKLCYNCANSATVNSTGITSSSDLCNTLDPSGFSTTTTSITLNSQTDVSQTECVKYYKYVIPSTPTPDSFVAFSVNFADFSNTPSLTPVFIQKTSSLPVIWIDNDGNPQQIADDLDLNGMKSPQMIHLLAYVNRKRYHYIKVNISKFTVGTEIYLGVYKFALNAENYYSGALEYEISTSDTGNPREFYKGLESCPADCNGKGICPEGICYCETGNFDLDCSRKAEKIVLNQNQQREILPYRWTYYYYVINDYSTDIRLNFTKSEGFLKSAMIFNKQNEYDLPNFVINSGLFDVPEDQNSDFWVITDTTLRKNYGNTMLIGLYNPNEFSINIEFKIIQTPEINPVRTTIMYVMIGVSAFLIVVWGIITVYKYKIQRDNEASEASSQQQEEQQDILSAEELEKFFPKKLFKELKTTFDQPTCSICLDEFQAETICRQIYCEHIFHCKCIESWLSNHKSCPNCKKEVTKNAIEAFLDELEKIKNQINSQAKTEAKIDHIHLKISDKTTEKEPERNQTEECKEGDMEERKMSLVVKEYMKETENKKPDVRIPSVNSESQLEVNGEMDNKEKNIPISNDPKDNHNAVINLSTKC